MYLLLGGGAVSYFIASKLHEDKKTVIIVEKDPKRAMDLRERGFDVVEGDMTNTQTLKMAKVNKASAVLIMTSDPRLNSKAAKAVKDITSEPLVIAKAGARGTSNEFKDEVDEVIIPTNVLADYAIQALEALEFKKKLKRLKGILAEAEKGVAIVTQNNPDPDAIASSLTFRRIVESFGKKADIIYGEEIGHDENRAMINLMAIEMIHRSKVRDFGGYSKIALIEASIPGVNNPLDRGVIPDIIIDHHQVDMRKVKGDYIDIRPAVGATSTIMVDYLTHLNREIDEELATALLYGIKTDTRDFTRGATAADLKAVAILYPKVNHDLLAKIGAPLMSAESLEVLGEAIKNRKVEGSYLMSNVGFIRDRETLPQAADYLLNLEGISTVLVYGVGKDVIHVSGRNRDIRLNLGDAMNKAFGEIGEAGGHAQAAAAKIPLGLFGAVKDKEALLKLAEEAIVDRFFQAVGIGEKEK
jgi:nanoRNase/pAp phosphatase (c-di-AMP/oligoRNAs hydrolase)